MKGDAGSEKMADNVKDEILVAWNKYLVEHGRRLRKNEGSSTQIEDAFRLFKQGIVNHARLSKREKEELLVQISSTKPGMQN